MSIILLVYLGYLPTTDYWLLQHDADGYWKLAEQHFSTGHFSFLSSFDAQRGYFLPLVLAPFARLAQLLEWPPLAMTRIVGAAVAAVVFGWAGPALWQALRGGAPVALGRRLLFAGLGFVLWRDYFNFCLTDFPALLALAIALISLLDRRAYRGSFWAGVAFAAAINLRPIYQAALPAVALLVMLPPAGFAGQRAAARFGAFALGLALLSAPQLITNYAHTSIPAPWVLATPEQPNSPNLYVQQLEWGLTTQKYETNIGGEYPIGNMEFVDQQGAAVFHSRYWGHLTELGQYAQLMLEHPLAVAAVWARHVFNGLDVQYPTPYIRQIFDLTLPLAWLNYSLWFVGLLFLARMARPAGGWLRPALVLLALLLPCAAVVPTAIECRYFLPLHLLLSAAVAFGATPAVWWRTWGGAQRTATVALYVVVVVGAFYASYQAQLTLYKMPRDIFKDVRTAPLPASNEPW